MKFAHYTMLLLAFALCACTQEEPIPTIDHMQVEGDVTPYYTTADVSIKCNLNGKENYLEYYLCYTNDGMNNPREQKMTFNNGICSCKLTGLEAGTSYSCQLKIVGFNSDTIQGVGAFQTKPFEYALVYTDQIISYSHTNAIVAISLATWGTDITPEWGVCYGTSPTVDYYKDNRIEFTGTTEWNTTNRCTINMSNLQDGVTYYVRAYAKNDWGVSYGKELSFTTIPYAIPTIETIDVSSVSANAAICYGNVVEDGGLTVENSGFCFAETENPTIQNTIAESSVAGVGHFSCVLQGLKSKTTYYVRAYATNAKGTAYGNQITFTTK